MTVIVNFRDVKSVKLALDEYPRLPNSDIEFNTFEVSDTDETGSATALMSLKASGRIKVRKRSPFLLFFSLLFLSPSLFS